MDNLPAGLTCAALKAAYEARRPPRGLIHHSDQGVQYASREYVALAEGYGMQIGMSRKGKPYDNPTVKSLFKSYKLIFTCFKRSHFKRIFIGFCPGITQE